MIAMLQKQDAQLMLNRTLNGKMVLMQPALKRGYFTVIVKKLFQFSLLFILTDLFIVNPAYSQEKEKEKKEQEKEKKKKEEEEEKDKDKKKTSNRILYGTASFYSNKFQGKKTANGEIFDQKKMTAACNVLPLGTWIRVTNLSNKRSVVVKTNDRLHTKMKRIVDLSRVAATQLGYINAGLTRVKVEVLGKKKPVQ